MSEEYDMILNMTNEEAIILLTNIMVNMNSFRGNGKSMTTARVTRALSMAIVSLKSDDIRRASHVEDRTVEFEMLDKIQGSFSNPVIPPNALREYFGVSPINKGDIK